MKRKNLHELVAFLHCKRQNTIYCLFEIFEYTVYLDNFSSHFEVEDSFRVDTPLEARRSLRAINGGILEDLYLG